MAPLLLAAALAAGLAPAAASAHTRSISHSSWRLDEDGARVRVRIPRLELTRIGLDAPPEDPSLSAVAGQYLSERLLLQTDAGPCRPAGPPEPRRADEGWAAFAWRLDCPGSAPEAIQTAVLLDVAPSHLHFARLARPDGKITERVLTEAEPRWALPGRADAAGAPTAGDPPSSFAAYGTLGIEHILTGWDHLAFVLTLLIVSRSLGEVARVVTGFTIAHSVTLALAVLGFVHPRAAAVEAVIGFSVALVAAEYAWNRGGRGRTLPWMAAGGLALCALLALADRGNVPLMTLLGLALFSGCYFGLLEHTTRPERVRGVLAFAFGLVHGFGFAGILGDMQLPTDRLVPALLGFNLGVEAGQLAVVALAWPLLRLLARPANGSWRDFVLDRLAAALCGIGVFWFVARTFGLP